jgi:hypothetical protein
VGSPSAEGASLDRASLDGASLDAASMEIASAGSRASVSLESPPPASAKGLDPPHARPLAINVSKKQWLAERSRALVRPPGM